MTDPSTPVPSDEAVEAAADEFMLDDGEPYLATEDARRGWARALLTAAYAIDAPRIAAEAAAEARADYDDFIKGLTAKLNAAGVPAMPSWPDAIDWLIKRAQSAQAEARAATLREVERLREVIRCAPHARHCEAGAPFFPGECSCWKFAALGGPDET